MSPSDRDIDPRNHAHPDPEDTADETLRQELLEYRFGCHSDPEALEARLANDADLRALLSEVDGMAGLLETAARESAPSLELTPPDSATTTAATTETTRVRRDVDIEARRRRFVRVFVRAAALLIAVGLGTTAAWWGYATSQIELQAQELARLEVTGPSNVATGASARFRLEALDHDREPVATKISWRLESLNGERELASGELDATGACDVEIPPILERAGRLTMTAASGERERTVRFALAPTPTGPLTHLSADKPVYRPGEVALLRATVLDRLTFEALRGAAPVQIRGPKDTTIIDQRLQLDEGVLSLHWPIPADASGGEYTFAVRDPRNAVDLETLALEVRRFQPPRLAKSIELDRETYAPGESGRAELVVSRVEGGAAEGATVEGKLVLDGNDAWTGAAALDAEGRASFDFSVPSQVERGDARFVAIVTDGGTVETAVEPFVVPTGRVDVSFYPEGGDLVAGVDNRVYFEATDPLGRPVSAEGDILDSRDRVVATVTTEHQGRGVFEIRPDADVEYRLRFRTPEASSISLPDAIDQGVVLRSLEDRTAAGEDVRFRVYAPHDGPWIAGVFCRGALAGTARFEKPGWNDVSVSLDDSMAGVLRITVFDSELEPRAERLVQRAPSRRISVDITPSVEDTAPGAHQTLEVVTRDESGEPVAAILGLTVSDRAVRDMKSEPRVGIADQAWLFADVEDLENLADFLPTTVEAPRNVDLLLGTLGWRRFAWIEQEQLIAEHETRGKELLAREGVAQLPMVRTDRGDDDNRSWYRARSKARTARASFALAATASVVLVLFGGLSLAFLKLMRNAGPLAVTSLSSFVLLLGVAVVLQMNSGLRDFAVGDAAPRAEFVEHSAGVEREDAWRLLDGQDMDRLWAQGYMYPDGLDEVRLGLPGLEGRQVARGFYGFDQYFANELDADDRGRLRALGYARQNDVVLGARVYFDDGGDGDPREQLDMGVDFRGLFGKLDMDLPFDMEEGESADWYIAKDDWLLGAKKKELAAGYEMSSRRQVRVYAHRNRHTPGRPRVDFTKTVYWNPLLKTNADGKARVEFDLSDRVTTWAIDADAHGAGRVGQGSGSFEAVPPFFLDAKLPIEVSVGDRLEIPIAAVSRTKAEAASVSVAAAGSLTVASGGRQEIALAEGRGRGIVTLDVGPAQAGTAIAIKGSAAGFEDAIGKPVRVVPRGFPHVVSRSGIVEASEEFEVASPTELEEGSLRARLSVHPSPLSDLLSGLDGILREPHGCFEQASSANYPNVLTLSYLDAAGIEAPAVARRARGLLDRGYDKIVGYECSERGYEWFGGDPGHEALTAYGLLEFHDMSAVFDVDRKMIERTREWLLGRRDGTGGYRRNARALDQFGRAPQSVTNAYITYALAASGTDVSTLERELDRAAERAVESGDPYEVALAALALQHSDRAEAANAARDRLKTMQKQNGSLVGTTTSITSSGSRDLAVETTSFAVLAWLADPADAVHVERGIEFLLANRNGSGTFGATQATITALRTLTEYARVHRRTATAGTAIVYVNDFEIARQDFAAGRREPIVFDDFDWELRPGSNRVRIEVTGGNVLPYAFEMSYRSRRPADDPEAKIRLATRLADRSVDEGDTVPVRVEITNATDDGVPMTVAIVGLPAGLEAPTEVLDDLKKAGRFDLYERRGREIILYWRGLAPRESRSFGIDTVARIPGTTEGPASRAWLYYTPQSKRWTEPLRVEVRPESRR